MLAAGNYLFLVVVPPTGNLNQPTQAQIQAALQAGLDATSIQGTVSTPPPSASFVIGVQAVGIDGSAVVPADAATTVQTALAADPEWSGATSIVATVEQD